jgi:hypothetical protein
MMKMMMSLHCHFQDIQAVVLPATDACPFASLRLIGIK